MLWSMSKRVRRTPVIVTMTIASAVTWYSIKNGKWQWHQHSYARMVICNVRPLSRIYTLMRWCISSEAVC